ncbi:MAG: hypothetical protein AAGH67_08070 [Cyanobacteria bacterium P01_H01_bin.162]
MMTLYRALALERYGGTLTAILRAAPNIAGQPTRHPVFRNGDRTH